MKVFNEQAQTTKEVSFRGTSEALLAKLNINPDTVLVVKDGELITLDTEIGDQDTIELLSVISGG